MEIENTQIDPNIPAPDSGNGGATPPATPDYAAIEEGLKKIDSSFSSQNIVEKVAEMRRGFSQQGRELNEIKTRYQTIEPFMREMDNNPDFREYVRSAITDFYGGQGAPAQRQPGYGAPNRIADSFDPVQRRVDDLETRMQVMRLEGEIADLKSRGFDVTEERRDAIIRRVLETGWGNARDHYMALFGEADIARREEAAARAATEAIRRNAGVTQQPTGSRQAPGSADKPDVTKMTEEEFDRYAIQRWAQGL